MGAILNLECFDEATQESSKLNWAKKTSYEDGFKDGEMAAEVAIAARQSQLNRGVSEALSDSAFGYKEAQAHFLTGMTSYVEAILETVLPATLSHGLHMGLRGILIDALRVDADSAVALRLPPDQIDVFSTIIADLDLTHITLVPDEALTENAAFVFGAHCETSLNLDEVLQTIKDHTAILLEQSTEVS
jgi:hypothetical protein